MTDYTRTTVESPEEAFDRLRDEFYVEEETEDGLVLIHERGPSPIDDPVRNLIEEEFGLVGFKASGQGIRYQRDLPEKFRDDEAFEREQVRASPAGESVSHDEANAIIRVLAAIRETEADSDHVSSLESAIDRVNELQDGTPIDDPDAHPDADDVTVALSILEREGVEYGLTDDHPNTVLMSALEFVELKENQGVIPDPEA